MDKPAILSNPEAFVVVPVEPAAWRWYDATHSQGYDVKYCQYEPTAGPYVTDVTALYEPQQDTATALTDIVAYCAALEEDHLEEKLGLLGRVEFLESNHAVPHLEARIAEAEARIAELEARLAEAERVIEPFAKFRTADGLPNGLLRVPDHHPMLWNMKNVDDLASMENTITISDLRAARTWKEKANG